MSLWYFPSSGLISPNESAGLSVARADRDICLWVMDIMMEQHQEVCSTEGPAVDTPSVLSMALSVDERRVLCNESAT